MKNLILINSMIRFLVEVTSFFILVIVGFYKFKFPFNIVIGIILPILLAIIWGIFIAPNSPNRLTNNYRLILELFIFVIVFIVLRLGGYSNLAFIYLAISVINSLINYIS